MTSSPMSNAEASISDPPSLPPLRLERGDTAGLTPPPPLSCALGEKTGVVGFTCTKGAVGRRRRRWKTRGRGGDSVFVRRRTTRYIQERHTPPSMQGMCTALPPASVYCQLRQVPFFGEGFTSLHFRLFPFSAREVVIKMLGLNRDPPFVTLPRTESSKQLLLLLQMRRYGQSYNLHFIECRPGTVGFFYEQNLGIGKCG